MTVVITIKEHLARLEAQETQRPPNQRRPVPSMAELAEAAGITRQGMYNFASGSVKMVNLEILSAVINELLRRGFPADVSDLLTAYPASTIADE